MAPSKRAPASRTASSPEPPTSVAEPPHRHTTAEYSFVLQTVLELQKSIGELTRATNDLATRVDARLGTQEEKLSGLSHRFTAAAAAVAVCLVIGGFFISKYFDRVAALVAAPAAGDPAIAQPAAAPAQGP